MATKLDSVDAISNETAEAKRIYKVVGTLENQESFSFLKDSHNNSPKALAATDKRSFTNSCWEGPQHTE